MFEGKATKGEQTTGLYKREKTNDERWPEIKEGIRGGLVYLFRVERRSMTMAGDRHRRCSYGGVGRGGGGGGGWFGRVVERREWGEVGGWGGVGIGGGGGEGSMGGGEVGEGG